LIIERQIPANDCIEYNSTTPNISHKSIILFSCNHFWRRIARTATGSLTLALPLIQIAESEIDNLDVPFRVEEQVLGFEVPVHDAQPVDIFGSGNQLLEVFAGLGLCDPFLANDVLEKLSVACEFHY
jgi:hypothetical protein